MQLVKKMDPKFNVLIKRGEDAQRRPYEDGGRDWSDAAAGQGTPRIS